MREERLKILKMLDEGKITVEEANSLLEALGLTGIEEKSGPEENQEKKDTFNIKEETREIIEELKEKGRRLKQNFDETKREEILAGVDEIKNRIEEGLEEGKKALSSQKGFLSMLLKNLGMGFEGRKVSWEFEGSFLNEGIKKVSLGTLNGNIRLRITEEDSYRVLVNGSVGNASDDEEALQKLKKGLEVTREEGILSVRVQGGQAIAASLYVTLPADEIYELEIHSSNGSITVEDARTEKISAETINGRVVLTGVKGESAELQTVNGRIETKGVEIKKLNTRTKNGSTEIEGKVEELNINSLNGSINVEPRLEAENIRLNVTNKNGRLKILFPEGDYGYKVDARSSMGSLKVELPGLKIDKDNIMERKKEIVASTLPGSAGTVEVVTRNIMGSTYIGQK